MARILDVPQQPSAALLDGALALALCTGLPVRLHSPLRGADLDVACAAGKLAGVDVRTDAAAMGTRELQLPKPRAGHHALELRTPGAVPRAIAAFSWPLALAGDSELVLTGPNHGGGGTFHSLRLGWAPLALRYGLTCELELHTAAFEAGEQGELSLRLGRGARDGVHLGHRGLLRAVTLLVASAGGREAAAEPLLAADAAARRLRITHGIAAEVERVPLPLASPSSRGRWALTGIAEFEHAVVTACAGPEGGPTRLPSAPPEEDPNGAGARVADLLGRVLERRGALDGVSAERLLIPAILTAAGIGGAAGHAHFTTAEVTPGLLELAQFAHTVFPIRAVIDGAQGEEGVVAVAPA